jgi:hypothetical protein
MTKRAILWCGHVREPVLRRDKFSRMREVSEPLLVTDDSKIQCNSLELSYQAALALGVDSAEIHACVIREDLLPQGFDPRRNHPATVDGLRCLVRSFASRAEPEDALLFIAVNHGNQSALATADPVDEFGEAGVAPQLTPAALDECLSLLGGSQVVVVATCHAGIFLSLEKRAGRAVLVACAAEEVYLVPRQDCAWSAFLDELFGAWCAFSLSDAVPRTRLSLQEAFIQAHARLVAEKAPNLPLCEGAAAWPA